MASANSTLRMPSEITILGMNGSPHKDGSTTSLLHAVLEGARSEGGTINLIHLYEQRIEHAPGLYSEDPTQEVISQMPEDDMKRSLYGEVLRADGLVLATPCYWANMSGAMKDFLDRLTPLENEGYSLQGKVAAFIAASKENEGGVEMAAMSMVAALMQMGVLIPPNAVMWVPGDWVNAKEAVPKWAEHDAPLVGRDMVRLIRLLKEQSFTWSTDVLQGNTL